MVTAGVLVRTEAGKTGQVLRNLRQNSKVLYAYAVFGRYDIITTIKDAKDLDEAARIITEEIASLDGVVETETLIVANI